MREHTRRGVAYILARLAGRPSGSVYDHATRTQVHLAGHVDHGAVQVFDYDRCAHLSGSRFRDGISLFDHGDGAHVQLSASGPGRYVGLDHGTKSHFEVQMIGRSIEIFDDQTRLLHVYTV